MLDWILYLIGAVFGLVAVGAVISVIAFIWMIKELD